MSTGRAFGRAARSGEAPASSTSVILLGPQRHQPAVAAALDSLGLDRAGATLATVTAGWQEREAEDQELAEHVGIPTVNLALYRRTEAVLERDPELAGAIRRRQDTLKDLRALYRLRLAHAMAACFEIARGDADPAGRTKEHGAAELDDAIEAVRALDRRHLTRVTEVHAEFEDQWRPLEREAVARGREEIASALGSAAALAIAGGHVAVLLNRLRLFAVVRLLAGKPVVAWSAGAMAIGERVVLFHDDPPQGPGNAEVFEAGLGLAPGVVPLPHARRRLRLDDPDRVRIMARRFAPATCIPLDDGDRIAWRGGAWALPEATRRLGRGGSVESRAA